MGKTKIAMLTSGGDCPGLNAALRGVAKSLYNTVPNVELYGINDGYLGLLEGNWTQMLPDAFSGIIKQGGTILGTSRQPFKTMQVKDENYKSDKLSLMLKNIKKAEFDCIVILGGNGTHKTANLLSENGVNVVTLPKTIDNDIFGTEITFGFDSAVDRATTVIDALHTTAASHGRVFVVELMGHKAGWLALHAGIAGGADVVLLPEIPYDAGQVVKSVAHRNQVGKRFSIVAIAEGAMTQAEADMGKKEQKAALAVGSAGQRLAETLTKELGQEVRATIPGHFQRGGDPTPNDRFLCSNLGAAAARLILDKNYGNMVAVRGGQIVPVPLREVAGKLKNVAPDCATVQRAKLMGITFGNE